MMPAAMASLLIPSTMPPAGAGVGAGKSAEAGAASAARVDAANKYECDMRTGRCLVHVPSPTTSSQVKSSQLDPTTQSSKLAALGRQEPPCSPTENQGPSCEKPKTRHRGIDRGHRSSKFMSIRRAIVEPHRGVVLKKICGALSCLVPVLVCLIASEHRGSGGRARSRSVYCSLFAGVYPLVCTDYGVFRDT